jgi:maltose O-acetyltransferase
MNLFRDVGNVLLQLLPVSRCFRVKRVILSLMGIRVEQGVSINGHVWFYGRGDVQIGRNTWVGTGCRFYSTVGTAIRIGANCDIAPEVSFVTGTHDVGTPERRAGPGRSDSVVLGDGCWLGVRVTVLGGVRIGNGTIVAACGLVRTDLPNNCLAAGVPAVPIRSLDGDRTPLQTMPLSQ